MSLSNKRVFVLVVSLILSSCAISERDNGLIYLSSDCSISICSSDDVLKESSDDDSSSFYNGNSFSSNSSSNSICSSDETITSTTSNDDSQEEHTEELYNLESKLELLDDYKMASDNYDLFCYFTDPHCYTFGLNSCSNELIEPERFVFLKKAYELSDSEFVFCGGDILCDGDTISQACYKISNFDNRMKANFKKYHFIIGNHDTNYQGDTWCLSSDWLSCQLSPEILGHLLFNGGKTYYMFETEKTAYYCFDSGIDWNLPMTPYRKEQIAWFADKLNECDKEHIAVLIHMALLWDNITLLPMMKEIGKVIQAYNSRLLFKCENTVYNYSESKGHIDFVQAGHNHLDINNLYCGGIPLILTTSFSNTQTPSFDFVFADYSNSIIRCIRIGDGEDREFNISIS